MYEKQNFKNGQVLTAEALNHIEDGIGANGSRVFMYHLDTESDTPALIETGDDWLHNSAVLDWLFRNGADGVDRAEAKVPCVVIIPVGGSGFAQNVYDWIVSNWGEEDGLVFFNVIFSSQFAEESSLINAYYSRAEGSTTWNKNQLKFGNDALQTVEDTPVERGAGAHSLQQKAEPNNENSASGLCSTAFGHSNEATEHCSYVEGYDNHSGGWASHVEGVENVAGLNAHFAHVGGTRCEASSECAFVHGRGLQATEEQAVFGSYNASAGGQALVVGGGSSNADRRNAFTVPKNPSSAAKVWDEQIVNETKSLSYADLVSLRNSACLIPGRFYRITDYGTTTTQFATRSYGHWFDVIVLALERNVLSENAWAIHSARDTDGYFANSDLSAWRLKYCLDNDTDRFTWADSEHGTGVIYQMEDEFGNIAPYDFKNIQYYVSNVIVVEKYNSKSIALSSPNNPVEFNTLRNFPVRRFSFATSRPAVGDLSSGGDVEVRQAWSANAAPSVGWVYSSRVLPAAGSAELDKTMQIRSLVISGLSRILPVIACGGYVQAEEPTSIIEFSRVSGEDIYITTYKGGDDVLVVNYAEEPRVDVWGSRMKIGGVANITSAPLLFELTSIARPYGVSDFEKIVVQAVTTPTSGVQLSDSLSSYIIVDSTGSPKEVTFESLAALLPATTTE